MLARIVDNKWIYIEQITDSEERIIDAAFCVEDPNRHYIDTSMGFFDGVYHKYNTFHHRLSRAFLEELKTVCDKRGLPLTVIDSRPIPKHIAPDPNTIGKDYLDGITLDGHQLNAIRAACPHEIGIINFPTGGGKTEVLAGIAKMFDCNTTVLGDMTIVVDQIKQRLELRKIAEEVGLFYAGSRPNGQKIIVGSFQSLIIPTKPKKTKKDTPESYLRKRAAYKSRCKKARMLRKMVKACDLLLVDECDKCSTKQWGNLFRYWFDGRRRYGFSGTPFDDSKPVENVIIKERFGSIIAEASRKELEDIGRIIPVSYIGMAFGDESKIKDKTAYDIAVNEQMIENGKFHRLISSIVNRELSSNPDDGILILVESRPLGYALESLIDNSKFLCGDHSQKTRREVVEKFENRELNTLIGGKIFARGLDLSGGCEVLILATGGKLWSGFDQKIGRAVRQNKKGRAKVYDFFHLGSHYLYAHSRSRLKAIVNMGYNAKVVFKNGVLDAKKFIESRFRRPKGSR